MGSTRWKLPQLASLLRISCVGFRSKVVYLAKPRFSEKYAILLQAFRRVTSLQAMHPDGNLTLDRAQTQSAALPIDPSTPVTWLAARTAAISTHQEGQRSSDNSRDLSVLSCSTALTSISPDGRAFSENFDE